MSNRDAIVAPSIDTLFGATVAQTAAPRRHASSGGTPAPSAVPGTGERAAVPDSEARAVITRTLIAAAASGELTPAQKRTLAQIVSERTGISQADAEKRVDQAYTDARGCARQGAQGGGVDRPGHGDGAARRFARRLVRGTERRPPSRREHAGALCI